MATPQDFTIQPYMFEPESNPEHEDIEQDEPLESRLEMNASQCDLWWGLTSASVPNSSWEMRCLRKHRRRFDDEGCCAKRRRLMLETEAGLADSCVSNTSPESPVSPQPPPAPPQPCPPPQTPSALSRPDTDSSCMEVEAAQRKLQEIEDRITLEDDVEDEDLDVEPAPRRPVLVLSDSLKEGLQRGFSDILPHTVAQSVSHSCMELVLWRPPDDSFCRRLRGSLQKQRKQQQQQPVSRHPPTPCPSPSPHTSPSDDPPSPLYSCPAPVSISGEEDMEM